MTTTARTTAIRRIGRMTATVPLIATALLVGAADADGRAAPPDAMIRAAHFSPTTPGVDVYLARFAGSRAPTKLWLSKVHYGAVSGYQALTPGLYTVAMRPAGAPSSTRPVLSWTLEAKPHAAYTVAGVGAGGSVRGVVVKDDLSAPPSGDGRVRVIQAASRAPSVTVTATGGRVIGRGVRFATVSKYATLPAGRWTVHASATPGASPATSGPVTVHNGQITSILLLDGRSTGITLRTVLDSASSGVMPADAVPAGAGGAATRIVDTGPDGSGPRDAGLIALAVSVLIGAAILGRRTVRRG